MQLDAADLGNGGKTLAPIDLQIGFLVAEYFDQFEQVRCPRHGMTLKELLAADVIRGSYHRARPSLDMVYQPWSDGFMVAGEIFLGDRLSVIGIRP